MNRFLHTLSLLVMLLAAVPAYSQNFVFDLSVEPSYLPLTLEPPGISTSTCARTLYALSSTPLKSGFFAFLVHQSVITRFLYPHSLRKIPYTL